MPLGVLCGTVTLSMRTILLTTALEPMSHPGCAKIHARPQRVARGTLSKGASPEQAVNRASITYARRSEEDDARLR